MRPKYKESDLIPIDNLPPELKDYIKGRCSKDAYLVMVNKVIFSTAPLYELHWDEENGNATGVRAVLCSYVDDDSVSQTNQEMRLECLKLACNWYPGQDVYEIADRMYEYVMRSNQESREDIPPSRIKVRDLDLPGRALSRIYECDLVYLDEVALAGRLNMFKGRNMGLVTLKIIEDELIKHGLWWSDKKPGDRLNVNRSPTYAIDNDNRPTHLRCVYGNGVDFTVGEIYKVHSWGDDNYPVIIDNQNKKFRRSLRNFIPDNLPT